MSSRTAEDLRELSYEYKKIIKPLHDYTTKHGQSLLIYSVYGQALEIHILRRGVRFKKAEWEERLLN